MSRIPTHLLLPEVARGGYPLDPPHQFGAYLPVATTNLFTNPSFETNTTGYSAQGGAVIARDSTKQRRGAYGLKVTPSAAQLDGVRIDFTITTTGDYAFSADVWAPAGRSYDIQITVQSSGATVTIMTFRGLGRWQRLWIGASLTGSILYRFRIRKSTGETNTDPFWTDGWQLEQRAYPTSYVDGDQPGMVGVLPAYLWSGTPHASQSMRHAQYRGGGKWVLLSELGFQLTDILGLGMTPTQSVITPAGQTGGGYYQRNVDQTRVFSLVGRFYAASTLRLQQDRVQFENLLRMSSTYPRQPLTLTYQYVDQDATPQGEKVEIECVYEGPGIGATIDNAYGEAMELRFTATRSALLQEGWTASALALSATVDDGQALLRIMQRLPTGAYAAVGAGVGDGEVLKIRYNRVNGLYYLVGSFTNGIKSYNPVTDTLSDLGSGLNGTAFDLDFDTSGNVIVGGSFTTAGGAAATRIAKWTIATSAWSTFGSGFNGSVLAVAVVKTGSAVLNSIYVAGDFTTANGVARARAASISSSGTYGTLGTGLGATGRAITIALDGLSVYFGGSFTSAGGVAGADYFARWSVAAGAWQAPGTSTTITDDVRALCTHPSGDIYIGGDFLLVLGDGADCVARYNGQSAFPVGAGLAQASNGTINDLTCDPITGDIFAAGDFNYFGPSTVASISGQNVRLPSPLARISGNVIMFLDTQLSQNLGSGDTANSMAIGPDRRILMAPQLTGLDPTMAVAGATTINRVGNADTWPVIEILGPGNGYTLRNATTGKEINFRNMQLQSSERVTIVLEPGNTSFFSNARGDMSSSMLPGSQPETFLLLGTTGLNSGENVITLYIDPDTDDANTTAIIRWKEAYGSLAATVESL